MKRIFENWLMRHISWILHRAFKFIWRLTILCLCNKSYIHKYVCGDVWIPSPPIWLHCNFRYQSTFHTHTFHSDQVRIQFSAHQFHFKGILESKYVNSYVIENNFKNKAVQNLMNVLLKLCIAYVCLMVKDWQIPS